MEILWLFRTNLRSLEYYHEFRDLETFKKKCHDFYLLMGIWMLENTELEEFVVWRLIDKNKYDGDNPVFIVNGKKFIQRFVCDFNDCFRYPGPDISFFRGGFPEYGKLTRAHARHFGLKLYLGAGQRVYPQHGGVYDKILVEDERDVKSGFDCIPFYKTANPNIFFPMDLEKKWDICWPCNFSQVKYKGQEWFISQIAKWDYLKTLKILHVGNQPEKGSAICRKYGVTNIEFKGWVERPKLNKYLNQSEIGLVTSNEMDGNPRVLTEILCSGSTLLQSKRTRSVNKTARHVFGENDISDKVLLILKFQLASEMDYLAKSFDWLMETVCQKNWELWNE